MPQSGIAQLKQRLQQRLQFVPLQVLVHKSNIPHECSSCFSC